MEHRELSKEEIISLIAEFKSEVRKNLAKIDFFNEKIEELAKLLGDKSAERVLRKVGTKARKPYPLSKWDMIIIDIVRENGKPVVSKDLYDKAMAKAVEMGIAMDEIKMKSKINQCLVKLASRRGDLKKVKTTGRGWAYAISE